MASTDSKIVAVIDTMWVGHHPTYFKWIVKSLLDLHCEVWAFCPKPEELYSWCVENVQEDLVRNLISKPMPEIWEFRSGYHSAFFSQGFNAASLWHISYRAISRLADVQKKMPSLAFFPKIDSLLSGALQPYIVDKIFPIKWSGIYFHPSHFRISRMCSKLPQEIVSKFIFRQGVLSPISTLKSDFCPSISVLDENIATRLSHHIKKKVYAFPDITDESEPDMNWDICREILQKARGRKIISVLGGLDRRKGIFNLYEISKRSVDKDWFFVFAGKVEYGQAEKDLNLLKEMISQSGGDSNLFCYFERVPDGPKFNSLVNASDVIYASYQNFPYSSNLMTKSALFKKPILVSKGALLEERVKKYEIGESIPENSIDDGVKAIDFLLNDFWHFKNPRFSEYFALHSQKRLSDYFKSVLDGNSK